ncbi:hypothetical protein Gasu2_24930 [Galdieria sulphuraria]|nr:hypothetical protein Gasu2_24930 [Galdieria sulphuraria]
MQQNSKGPLSGKAWWSGLLTGTVLFALLIPYLSNLAFNDVVLTEDDINLKLRQIPVFAVTDGEGKPFLLESPMNEKQRDGYFFVDKDDAVSFEELVTSQDTEVKTKIFPLTLDVAERFIQGKIDPSYVSSSDRFHLTPNVEDLEFADLILKTKFDRADVPVFAVEKLRLEVQISLHKESEEKEGSVSEQPQVKRIIPLFLKKQDLESLLNAAKKNSEKNFDPVVQMTLCFIHPKSHWNISKNYRLHDKFYARRQSQSTILYCKGISSNSIFSLPRYLRIGFCLKV